MIPKEIRACLVDCDGTLYRSAPLKLAMAAELALLGPLAIPTLWRFRREHEVDFGANPSAASPFEAQLERAARKLRRDKEAVRRIVDDWMFERPRKWIALFRRRALLLELDEFRSRGGRLALVSDYPVRGKIDRLSTKFDVIVSSGEPGGPARLKPDPEGYLSAARRLDVPPNHCLVIGDRQDRDGEAAARAGMAFRLIG